MIALLTGVVSAAAGRSEARGAAEATGAPREIVLPNRGPRSGMCPFFTQDGKSLLWFDGHGVAIWDLAAEQVVGTIEPAWSPFVVSADGTKLATDVHPPLGGGGGRGPVEYAVKIYDLATHKEMMQLSRPAGEDQPGGPKRELFFMTCGFDAGAGKLFTITNVDVQVWDLKTGRMLRRIARPKPPHNNRSARSPDGRYLTIGGTVPGGVDVLDTRSETWLSIRAGREDLGKVLGKPKGGYASSLGSWSFPADGRSLHGTDQLNEVLLTWSLPRGTMIDGVRIPGLLFAIVSPDGSRVLARYREAEERRVVRVLDAKTRQVLATLGPMEDAASWNAISPDNRWVFVSSVGDTRLWDMGARKR